MVAKKEKKISLADYLVLHSSLTSFVLSVSKVLEAVGKFSSWMIDAPGGWGGAAWVGSGQAFFGGGAEVKRRMRQKNERSCSFRRRKSVNVC